MKASDVVVSFKVDEATKRKIRFLRDWRSRWYGTLAAVDGKPRTAWTEYNDCDKEPFPRYKEEWQKGWDKWTSGQPWGRLKIFYYKTKEKLFYGRRNRNTNV